MPFASLNDRLTPRHAHAAVRMLAGSLALGVALVACVTEPPAAAPESPVTPIVQAQAAPVEDANTPSPYSPFVVQLTGGQVENISFKDVGLSFGDEASAVYEAMANALASEIVAESALPWTAQMTYEPAVMDPANHVFCGDRHVYVDLWRSESPERWGYSLWSGCGEESQFAWEEVTTADAAWMNNVTPVAQAITADLSDAHETGCFVRTC